MVVCAVRDYWPILSACALGLPAVVVALSLAFPARYKATAELRHTLPALDRDTVRLLDIAPDPVPSATSLPDSPAAAAERVTLAQAAEAVGLPSAALEDAVEVGRAQPSGDGLATTATPGEQRITASARDPEHAARLANGYAAAYVASRRYLVRRRAIERRKRARGVDAAELTLLPSLEAANVTLYRLAKPPGSSSTSLPRSMAAAVALGLWLGMGAALLARRRAGRLRTR
jgi:hypothetical protein